ncbi:MAG: hypothetical protein PF694_02235 [Bacteroidetes bacterium]|jgi:hypothetical protein|nr:hypothetical protein [Bacteroidota bacterium]
MRFFRSILVLLLSLYFLPAISQEDNYFSADSESFIFQVETLLADHPSKDYVERGKELMELLKPRWEVGRFSKAEKDQIKLLSELMYQQKLRNFPYFYDFFTAIKALAYSNQKEQSVLNWLGLMQRILLEQSSRDFSNYLDFSNDFFKHGLLSKKGSASWYLRNPDYWFSSDTALQIIVDKADLVCATARDSSLISATSGTFMFEMNAWSGKGGKVDWWRFDLDAAKLFVELNNYVIDLSQPEYEADSVTFYHKYYFDFPMRGKFQDKVHSSPPGSRTSYPRFYAYFNDYSIKNLFNGIDFNGGIALEGATLKGIGEGSRKAELLIKSDDKIQVRLESVEFVLNENKIFSEHVSANVSLENDSVFHPNAQMRYDDLLRRLILFRSEKGVADSPFFDSYHKLDLHLEALYWNIDEKLIQFKQLEGMRSESAGYLESVNFFSAADFSSLRLIDDINPMFIVENYLKEFGRENDIKLDWYANFIKKPPEQAIAQLMRLASKGYLVYDSKTQVANVKERFFNTLKARADETDFDVIRIATKTIGNQPNIELNLESYEMNLLGVEEVILSDEQRVRILPKNNTITFTENRDFSFTGFVGAGLFEFYAGEAYFNYDEFSLNLTHVDSLSFFVPAFEQNIAPGAGKQFVRVQNVIANMSGTLYIDQSDNKSGRNHFPQYPIFDSKNESYVYFEQPFINEGRLIKSEFFYVVEPFEIDSLDDFSTDNLGFEGYLNSAGIFEVIVEPLAVMPDYSLGFDHSTADHYEMFSGKGFFDHTVHLSNKGFWGTGKLNYQTSSAIADSFIFYPDEVAAMPHRFEMKEQQQQVLFPQAQSDTIQYHWFADTNLVVLNTMASPLVLYNNVLFKGTAELSPQGLKASGDLSFGNVEMSSAYFELKNQSFTADTADFKLLTAVNQQVAFAAKDYFTAIDFEARTGNFHYLNQESKLSFPFNQYICTLNEAIWLMDEDMLNLNNNGLAKFNDFDSLSYEGLLDYDLSGSEFISIHPEQDSLSFFSMEASYDFRNYAIKANDVKLIRVADMAVYPADGKVSILEGARMETLRNAHMLVDTANRFHHFNQVEINIFGKNRYQASGYYDYINSEKTIYPVFFSSISANEKQITSATGIIEEQAALKLSPQFNFQGRANLLANRKGLAFDGGFQLVHFCNKISSPWVRFSAVVDPNNVAFPIGEEVQDIDGNSLYSGLLFNSIDRDFYASFLSAANASKTMNATTISGLLKYNRAKSAFTISKGKESVFEESLSFSPNRCLVSGKGAIDLGLNIPMTTLSVFGNYDYFSIPDSISINSMAVFDFIFDEKLLQMMADSLNRAAVQGANLGSGNYLFGLNTYLSPENFSRVQSELSLYGTVRKVPDVLVKSMVFSDLKMSWDAESESFIASGDIGLANVLKTQVNKKLHGYVVLKKDRSGDAVTIYLQPSKAEWYFFHYENGVMQALSSSEAFNSYLMELSQDKRVVKDDKTDYYYEYVIGSRRRVVDFIRKNANY